MIAGQFFDGKSSTPWPAQLDFSADGVVHILGTPEPRNVPLSAITVSDRVGRTPRRLRFADGAVFESLENDAIDAGLIALGHHHFSRRVDKWERAWKPAMAALVAIVVLSVGFVVFGIPLMANLAARVLPPSVDRAIGSQGLAIFDRSVLSPSELAPSRQKALRARFDAMTAPLDDGHRYRLELRNSATIGANAFALPDGIIVMTDQLVALAQNDDEIVAVLAHEIGHVRKRHALRMILQSTGVAAIAFAVLGDASSISALAAAAPAALINAKHSRDFEREADGFAKEWLQENHIASNRFDDLLCRLAKEHGSTPGSMSYLESHPPIDERAQCASR